MESKSLKRVLSLMVCMAMVFGFCSFLADIDVSAGLGYWPEPLPISNEFHYQNETLQPYGACFQIDELKNWTPEVDPDARYNRGSVPLKERWMGPSVNEGASRDAKMYPLAMTNARASEAPSQGGDGSFVYAFNNFQYTTTYCFWGGSSAEGPIAVPSPEHIDSAHRNGVPATGSIHLPWGDAAFGTQFVREMVEQDEDGNFVAADKLIEIAEYYGFDGWMFNSESGSGNPKFKEFLIYMQKKAPENFEVTWYNGTGSLSESSVKSWLHDGENKINDNWWLDMSGGYSVNNTVNAMKSSGLSEWDAFSSWEYIPMSSSAKGGHYATRLDEEGKLKISLGILAPTSTLAQAKDASDFLNEQDQAMWVGPTKDPTANIRKNNTSDPDFPGFATLLADRTPIVGTEFTTHFNPGNGYKFYENGVSTGKTKDGWHNRSLTEVLPTWRWIIESGGSKLDAIVDYEDAWWGGASLKFSGNLDANKGNRIPLYSTKLDVTDETKLSLTHKTAKAGVDFSVGVCYGDTYDEENFVYYPVETTANGEWSTSTIDLSNAAGKTAIAIALKFDSDADVSDYAINVGKLSVYTNDDLAAATSKIAIDEVIYPTDKNAEARIYWEDVDNAELYTIHRVYQDGTKEYIGATPNDAFYLGSFDKAGSERTAKFEITSVSGNGTKGGSKTVDIKWPQEVENGFDPIPQTGENLALNIPAVSSRNTTDDGPVHLVNDGTIGGSKWCVTSRSGYAVLDLGENTDISRWIVYHANTRGAGEGLDFNTIDFDLQYAPDDGEALIVGDTQAERSRVAKITFTNADSVNNNIKDVTDRNLDEPISARYIKLNVRRSDKSPWAAIRIYDFELYENPGTTPVTAPRTPLARNVSVKNNFEDTDTVVIDNVDMFYATGSYASGGKISENSGVVNLYDSLDATEPIATVKATQPNESYKQRGLSIASFEELDLDPTGGRLFFEVLDESAAGEITPSPRGSVSYSPEIGNGLRVPRPASQKLERVVQGKNLRDHFGVLTLRGLEEDTYVRIFDSYEAKTPIVHSALADALGTLRIERIPLNPEGGSVYFELYNEGMVDSARYEFTYGSTSAMAVDKYSFEEMIVRFSEYAKSGKTSSTWTGFEAGLDNAKALYAKTKITGAEAVNALDKLTVARAGLRSIADTQRFAEIYDDYTEKYSAEDYSKASWKAFEGKLSEVKEMIDGIDDGTLETNIFEAKDLRIALEAAKDALSLRVPHNITVDSAAVNGTFTFEPTSAKEGEIVTITPVADEKYQFVDDSITVNGEAIDGLTFEMPHANVVINGVFEKIPPITVKKILEKAIKEAEEIKANTELWDTLYDSVKEEVNTVLIEAKTVFEDRYAEQTEINDVVMKLFSAISKTNHIKGDKSYLEIAVVISAEIEVDLVDYVDGADKEAFIEALRIARKGMALEDISQEELDRTADELVDALLDLRLKVNKSILKSAVQKARTLDLTDYTKESVTALTTLLIKAEDVIADQTLTAEDNQAMVNVLAKDVNTAANNLVEKKASTEAPKDKELGTTVTEKPVAEKTDKNVEKDEVVPVKAETKGSTSPRTGEAFSIIIASILAVSIASVFVLKKKREEEA